MRFSLRWKLSENCGNPQTSKRTFFFQIILIIITSVRGSRGRLFVLSGLWTEPILLPQFRSVNRTHNFPHFRSVDKTDNPPHFRTGARSHDHPHIKLHKICNFRPLQRVKSFLHNTKWTCTKNRMTCFFPVFPWNEYMHYFVIVITRHSWG